MSKSLPVYELGQWIERDDKTDKSVGFVVARMVGAGPWEVHTDYAKRKDVQRFSGRGPGYLVQWVVVYDDKGRSDWGKGVFIPHCAEPTRLCWLRAETIAEKRYQPCDNPVKAPVVAEQDEGEEVTEFERNREGVVTFGAPSQPVLPLDIEAATEATMRAAVALGNRAADWLRAKGLTL